MLNHFKVHNWKNICLWKKCQRYHIKMHIFCDYTHLIDSVTGKHSYFHPQIIFYMLYVFQHNQADANTSFKCLFLNHHIRPKFIATVKNNNSRKKM